MQESKKIGESREFSEVRAKNRFLSKVYWWMTAALAISAGVAFFASTSPFVVNLLFGRGAVPFILVCVAEIVLVFWLSSKIRTISVAAASVGFVVYSALNGLTLSAVFLAYRLGSIFQIFIVSAALFAAMAVYGSFTKSNLSSVGRYFTMALIGVIVASLVNFFLKSTMIQWFVSVATVLIFTGLTAYDAQKLMGASEAAESQSEDVFNKASIIGALELYLDFINIFLALLRLFGKRR